MVEEEGKAERVGGEGMGSDEALLVTLSKKTKLDDKRPRIDDNPPLLEDAFLGFSVNEPDPE